MSYNIEDQEEYLKNESPYELSDSKWAAMQQKIKTNVLNAAAEEAKAPSRIIKFNYMKITAAAASLFIIVAIGLFFGLSHNKQQSITIPDSNLATNQTVRADSKSAEQKLDNAISNLNEAELNLSHQMSENEISEQNEYFED